MSTINNVNGSNVFEQINQNNQASSKAQSSTESDSDMFMKLMIAQLQNQDPTSPADTTDFMQQIATMSTVESIANLTSTVESMGQTLMSSQAALQASSMVGQRAFVATDLASLPEEGQVDGFVTLENAAADVWLSVYDQNGVLVDRLQMGPQVSGDHAFIWPGNDNTPAGQYRILAQAVNGTETQTVPVYLGHRINSVTLGQNGIGMQVNTDAGSTSIDNIKQLG